MTDIDSIVLVTLEQMEGLTVTTSRKDAQGVPSRRVWVLGVGAPTALTIIALIVSVRWYSQLPNPVAVHWGPTGQPDGFGSPATYLILVLVGWLVALLLALPVALHFKDGAYGSTFRFLIAVSAWVSLLISSVSVGAQWVQLGLSDATASPSIIPVLLLSILVAAVLALAVYAVLPGCVASSRSADRVEPMSLARTEKGAWAGKAVTSRWITIPVACAVVVSIPFCVFIASTDAPIAWFWLGLSLFLAVTLLMFGAFKVSVGAQGLIVRSYLGWTARHIPLMEIDDVALVQVDPLSQWGGYGWRIGSEGTAVVTRGGPALQVSLTSGKVFVVTVDDPAPGAALLAAMAANSRAS